MTTMPLMIDSSDLELDAVFKRLHLANARRVWRDLVARAERDEWSYARFLSVLVAEEIAHRQQTRLTRLSRRASFPFLKTIDDFDFTYQSTVRLALLGSALSPDFISEGRSLILYGKPGRGKTHLAVAIAYRAIQNGFDAHFVTAAELIDDLSAAFRQGRLAEVLPLYTHPALLVVDEVGYLTYGTDAANMLFHVVNDRHKRRRAMIFTTNKPLALWGSVLHDDDLALAIVDRILERGRLLTLDGPSMRTKHLGLHDPTAPDPQRQVVRISGIHAPEFPEPTDLERCSFRYSVRVRRYDPRSAPADIKMRFRSKLVHVIQQRCSRIDEIRMLNSAALHVMKGNASVSIRLQRNADLVRRSICLPHAAEFTPVRRDSDDHCVMGRQP